MSKKRFYEVDLIRVILIVLLVAFHAFCPYLHVDGGWPVLYNQDIPAYWWLGWALYAVMLPAFVFISGYLFGNQVVKSGGVKFKSLVVNKFKRLMIPSILFSALYFFTILETKDEFYLFKTVEFIVYRGVGHMWFLPMLFMCFICTWVIHRLRLRPRFVLPCLMLFTICFVRSFWLADVSPFYLFFFYAGFCLKVYDVDALQYANAKNISVLTVIAVVMFIIAYTFDLHSICNVSIDDYRVLVKISSWEAARFLYAIPGVMALYLWSIRRVYVDKKTLPISLQKLVGTCFGVYLFQEFILQTLYYHTSVPGYLSPYLLPFVGIVVTLPLSILLTKAFQTTKIGRILLGQ